MRERLAVSFQRSAFSEKSMYWVIFILLGLLLASPARAQDKPAVTDDQVNAVARQLYCPVCENIPLDVCDTLACAQWRDEIRVQLTAGKTPTQVIADFIQRYGDRVVGTPQDPTLRALALVTPWLVGGLALIIALVLLMRWRGGRAAFKVKPASDTPALLSDEDYLARLERDLQMRR
jgi:cytochrome c-type biogenesis protein CcmH